MTQGMFRARGLTYSFLGVFAILGQVLLVWAAEQTEDHSVLVVRICAKGRCPPHSEEAIRGWLWRGPRSADGLFRESSYGKVRFPESLGELTTVEVWMDWPDKGWKKCPNGRMEEKALEIRKQRGLPDISTFRHVLYWYDWLPEPPCLNDVTNGRIVRMATGGFVAAHELGHNIGLPHGDATTMMGGSWGGVLASFRFWKGWMPSGSTLLLPVRCSTKDPLRQTITLQALHWFPGSRWQGHQTYSMLRIPRSRGGEYHVSFRADGGYDGFMPEKYRNKVHVYQTAGDPRPVQFFDEDSAGWTGFGGGWTTMAGMLPVGKVVRLHSAAHNRFVRMTKSFRMDTSHWTRNNNLKPGSWWITLFKVVDGGNGEVALYSILHERFVRMNDKGDLDTSAPRVAGDLTPPSEWEKFTVVRAGSRDIALHNRFHNRFVRMNGIDMDASAPKGAKDLPANWKWERFTVVNDDFYTDTFTFRVVQRTSRYVVLSYELSKCSTTTTTTRAATCEGKVPDWQLLYSGWIKSYETHIEPSIHALGQLVPSISTRCNYQQVYLECGGSTGTGVQRVLNLASLQTQAKKADPNQIRSVDYYSGDVNSNRPGDYKWGNSWAEMHTLKPSRFIIRKWQIHCNMPVEQIADPHNNAKLGQYGRVWVRNSSCIPTQAELPTRIVKTTETTTTTISTTVATTVVTTTSTGIAPTTTSGTGIQSGDTIFLKTRAGHGNHIDVEGTAVQARWDSQGKFQALVIEKENGGTVNSGDIVYLKTHTGAHIDVTDEVVQARWNDQGGWQAMVIEKRTGNGAILPGDSVCFKAHTGKHLGVEGAAVRARWHDCHDWQAMLLQQEADGALFSGASIHLLAHTGNRVEVEGSAVKARWPEQGQWQTFVIENYGGRAIFSGDAVFLKAHTGKLVDVQGVAVQARWNDWGQWQKLFIEKKHGGAIMPGDTIFLRAHTGKMIEVQGEAVQAHWEDRRTWQSFVIEKSNLRRLTQTMDAAILV